MKVVSAALLVCAGLVGVACGGHDPERKAREPRPKATAAPAPAGREATATPAPRTGDPAGWSRGRVMRQLAGRRIRVGDRRVALDPETLACSGLGRPEDRSGERRWTAFRCVQPTFPPGRVAGPDAVFIARVTGDGAVRVEGRRLTRY